MKNISKGFWFVILFSVLWALLIFTNKIIFNQGENEFNLIFWTSILSFPFWFAMTIKNRGEVRKLNKKAIMLLLLTGILSGAVVKILEALALKNTTSINFSFLVRTAVIFTIIFEFIILKAPITKKKILLSIILLIGIYMLVVKGQVIVFNLGDLFTIAEAAVIGFSGNVLGKLTTKLMSVKMSAIGNFMIGFLPNIILAMSATQISLPVNIYLVVIASVINIAMIFTRFAALNAASPSSVTMIVSVTPLWVTLLAVSFLGESMNPLQIIGGAIIISAVFIVEKLKV